MRLKVCVMSVEAAFVYWNFGSKMLLKAIAASLVCVSNSCANNLAS
jgi:hypothetical protein